MGGQLLLDMQIEIRMLRPKYPYLAIFNTVGADYSASTLKVANWCAVFQNWSTGIGVRKLESLWRSRT